MKYIIIKMKHSWGNQFRIFPLSELRYLEFDIEPAYLTIKFGEENCMGEAEEFNQLSFEVFFLNESMTFFRIEIKEA